MSIQSMIDKKLKNKARVLEVNISEANLKAQIGAFLQAMSLVKDEEDIIDLEIGQPDKDKVVPLKVYIKKEVLKKSG